VSQTGYPSAPKHADHRAPDERKVRIEVGYGFEGTLTYAVSKLAIEHSIGPRFSVDDFAGGTGRGVDDIIQGESVRRNGRRVPKTTGRSAEPG
jgi:uncharacterized membrane protein YgcG